MNQYSRDALYHHGVIGMKWGIRRYQPYGQGYDPKKPGKFVGRLPKNAKAKDYQRALNKLERTWAAEQAKNRKAIDDNNRHAVLYIAERNKNPKSKKLPKLKERINKEYDRVAVDHEKIENALGQEFDRILKMAMDQGYDVVRTDKKEYVETGNRFVDFWLDSPTARRVSPERVVDVARFKVKKSKNQSGPMYTRPIGFEGNTNSAPGKQRILFRT